MKSYRFLSLILSDVAGFLLGFLLFILVIFSNSLFWETVQSHLPSFLVLILVWFGVFYIFNFYEIKDAKPNLVFLKNYFIASIIMVGIGFIFFYLNPLTNITPKTNLLVFAGFSLIIILILRRLSFLLLNTYTKTTLAVICQDENHYDFIDALRKNPELGYVCIGIYSSLQEFQESSPQVDIIVVHTTTIQDASQIDAILGGSADVIDLTEAYEIILNKIPVSVVTSDWIIHSIKKQNDFFYSLILQIISILFAIIVLLITLPITLVTACAIWLEDKGTIFYTQTRTGLHGKPFSIIKFRSMFLNAEQSGAVWSSGDNDPRITKIGSIIRKLHIDEIPQMINILRGDITLVGPRPERPEFVEDLKKKVPYYFMRNTVKPGFTGWAQIKFRYARSVEDSREKFEYDLFYIKNRNIFLDIGIILKTAQIVFTHAGK